MSNSQATHSKQYDLEERTLIFARTVISLCKELSHNSVNFKLVDQLIRSTGSVGANYREANDSLGKKDFVYRLRIARKEAKETIFWLQLLLEANLDKETQISPLISECIELRNILSAIINKSV